MPSINLYDYAHDQLAEQIAPWGGRAPHVVQLWSYLYRQQVTTIEGMTDLPPRLLARLISEAHVGTLKAARETASDDGFTRKYLLNLGDDQQVETVLMQFDQRQTACLSSQAGCAFGCVFCATGQMGLTRDLTTGEIVAQALFVDRIARAGGDAPGRRGLRNLVLMGMGEPLHNYDAVMRALDILSHPASLAIGSKRITLSTVGVVPGIVRLADEGRPYSLAVSLHAATQEARAAIVPAARAWPLDVLMDACRYYTTKLDKKIFFEWTIIDGRNDSPDEARQLAELLTGMPAHVNLIPLNPTSGYDGTPGTTERVTRFKTILQEHGLPATVRQRRGIDIAAGCGQLATTE